MKRKQQNRLTDHHMQPRSRGGSDEPGNIKRVPDKTHNAFHQVFENLTQEEAHQYLDEIWYNPRGRFRNAKEWLNKRPR